MIASFAHVDRMFSAWSSLFLTYLLIRRVQCYDLVLLWIVWLYAHGVFLIHGAMDDTVLLAEASSDCVVLSFNLALITAQKKRWLWSYTGIPCYLRCQARAASSFISVVSGSDVKQLRIFKLIHNHALVPQLVFLTPYRNPDWMLDICLESSLSNRTDFSSCPQLSAARSSSAIYVSGIG
ncbi:hypothetical protein GCK32_014846 [Trichostrongylus colubriformis]|uniref:Uncharacterized protein n=1 Tax=Trichostrongylus colubriformis TaxID=6319 RepID=A0AAN8FH56_TRICO